jgi:hypothetical protein
VLEPGRAAHALLGMQDVSSGTCPTYHRLLVTPPDSRRTQSVKVDVAPCDGNMRVSVVLPGEG